MPSDEAQPEPAGAGTGVEAGAQGTESLACVSCRARKLKCDRVKPNCGRCVKVSQECIYPESRRKPTFKRRNVKELEARLAQVEDYLKEVNKNPEGRADNGGAPLRDDLNAEYIDLSFGVDAMNSSDIPQMSQGMPNFQWEQGQASSIPDPMQLVDLGMNEALPPWEVMEELNNTFFQTYYHIVPIIHRARYLQSWYSAPHLKPPMCLQYAIWAQAAFGHEKYEQYQHVFYQRARQYAEGDEMRGQGEHFTTLSHAQAWAIIAGWEAKNMLFTRAAMSSAKCVRLVQMMGLNRLDGDLNSLPPTLAPPTTWAEKEERRRVFWGAFTIDSHASISTGWPSLIDAQDIMTRLPAPEQAFASGQQEGAPFLQEAFQGASYTGFGATVVTCQILKLILQHVHRPRAEEEAQDLVNGKYWIRHRDLDNQISSVFMFLPEKLRLPQSVRDPVALHLNLNLHASTICLHRDAIEKIDENGLDDAARHISLARLKTAAEEISGIMKLASHSASTGFKSPLFALSLYCATTVYIYLAKQNPDIGLTPVDVSNLRLIVQAMEAIARNHKITRAFLQQTCLDIERNGLDSCIQMPNLGKYRDSFGGCASNIPLLTRSAILRDTGIPPVLPGKLPLKEPEELVQPSWMKLAGTEMEPQRQPGFQPMLGAVTRNFTATTTQQGSDELGNKRKRLNESPVPERNPIMKDFANTSSSKNTSINDNNNIASQTNPWLPNNDMAYQGTMPQGFIVLPDRTDSSNGSSPMTHGLRTESQSTTSNSNGTSQSIGLGNTAEENRIDLRAFQDRVSTPLWPTTIDEAGMVQFTQALMGEAMNGPSDPWGILNGDVQWDPAG